MSKRVFPQVSIQKLVKLWSWGARLQFKQGAELDIGRVLLIRYAWKSQDLGGHEVLCQVPERCCSQIVSTGIGVPVRKAWGSFGISNGNPRILKMPGRYVSHGTQVREKSRCKREATYAAMMNCVPSAWKPDSSTFKLFLPCSRSQQPEKVTNTVLNGQTYKEEDSQFLWFQMTS